eukprot:5046901-Alexandrium_andersonii.AAC.1
MNSKSANKVRKVCSPLPTNPFCCWRSGLSCAETVSGMPFVSRDLARTTPRRYLAKAQHLSPVG